MASWDPYPELQNVENYCGCNPGQTYRSIYNNVDANYNPLQKAVISGGSVIKEGWQSPCCRPTPYNTLNNTWSIQKPYSS